MKTHQEIQDLYPRAVELVTRERRASVSRFQRVFNLSFADACLLMNLLKIRGIIDSFPTPREK